MEESKYSLKKGSHILIVSDGSDEDWRSEHGLNPLIGGVKSFTETLAPMLRHLGYKVTFLHPYSIDEKSQPLFVRINIPFYDGFEVAIINPLNNPIAQKLDSKDIDAVFIATVEGPLGFSAKQQCEKRKIPYTLAYTTNHAEYIEKIVGIATNDLFTIPAQTFDGIAQRLFSKAHKVLVPTPIMQRRLNEIGIKDSIIWPRGVDEKMFSPQKDDEINPYLQYDWYKEKSNLPILLYFGRVSSEKNIKEFLDITQLEYLNTCKTNCHIVIIGDGPQLEEYKEEYKERHDIHFLGGFTRNQMPPFIKFANVFVFPSRFDTFGNVILEAGASGVPTVGYKGKNIATQDVIKDGKTGVLVSNKKGLVDGIGKALELDKEICRQITLDNYSWDTSVQILLQNLKKK